MTDEQRREVAKQIASPVLHMVQPNDPKGYEEWLDAIVVRLKQYEEELDELPGMLEG